KSHVAERRTGPSASTPPLAGGGRAIADTSRKIEIPIAIDCGPRVPSSGTFVRLPAPETLHASGRALRAATLKSGHSGLAWASS
ncbi:hypothetical protein EOC84_31360, partial [Mesorhizobium sp. Primo-B]